MSRILNFSAGIDKPGIVSAFTKVLYDFKCNIEDTSMTIVCKLFSMILAISYPEDMNIEALKDALIDVEDKFDLFTNIQIFNKEDIENCSYQGYKPYMLSVSGKDQVGITYQMTDILAKHAINITDFNSKLVSKEDKHIYIMMVETLVPEGVFEKALKDLKQKAKDLSVDLTFREIETYDQL